jgi:hypothetical protein
VRLSKRKSRRWNLPLPRYGKFIDGTSKSNFEKFQSASDLYEGIFVGLKQHPDTPAVYLLTDFEDGGSDEATYAMVDVLRKQHLKLYLCSVEAYPYDGLVQYAYESGGGYLQMTKAEITSFKPMKEHGDP